MYLHFLDIKTRGFERKFAFIALFDFLNFHGSVPIFGKIFCDYRTIVSPVRNGMQMSTSCNCYLLIVVNLEKCFLI